MKTTRSILALGLTAALASTALAAGTGYDKPVTFDLTFVLHVDKNMPEQDAFVERKPGSGKVFRATKGERKLDQPVYATARPVHHNPFDPEALGPYPKGEKLGVTLGQWLEAKGHGSYTCKDGAGRIDTRFTKLLPNGVYTMWHFFMAMPPTEPFIGTHDLPLGARDGSQSVFKADTDGNVRFVQDFKPCLQLTGEHLMSGLAIAYHSDGKTYGPLPGDFGSKAHVQLFLMLPKRAGL